MIYVYELLIPSERTYLESIEPYTDFRYDYKKGVYYWTTFCARVEMVDGIKRDIRRLKVYKLNDARRGFIVDDFYEAKELAMYMSGDIDKKGLDDKYPDIVPYLKSLDDYSWVDFIFIPVTEYIRHYQRFGPSQLDLIDLQSLNDGEC